MQDDYFYYMNVVKLVTNLLVLLSVYNVRVLMPTETEHECSSVRILDVF